MRWLRLGTTFLAALVLSGCHTYVPVGIEDVSPDMAVRLRIADRPTSPPLEGSVVEVGSDADRITVLPEVGVESVYPDGPLSLSVGEIQSLERRELNQTRTALLIGGTGVALIGTILLVDGNPSSDSPRPGGGTVFFRLPLGGFGGH